MFNVQKLRNRFVPMGGFAHSVSLLAGGTVLAQTLGVLGTPVLTRIYRAEDFGYFQIYFSVMAFATVAVTLRFEQAIFLPGRDSAAADVLFVALGSVCSLSVLCGFVLWLVHRYYVLPRNLQGLVAYLWLIPLAMWGAGVYQCLSTWALRQKGFSRVSGTRITQVGTQLSAQILVGCLHFGPLGLLAGDAIGRFAGSLSLARFAWRRSCDIFRQTIDFQRLWSAAVRYRRFPLVSSGSALIGVAAAALPPVLIAELYGAKTLGWFALGDRVLGAPAVLIGQAISQVYSLNVAALSSSDPKRLQSLFLKSARRLAVLGIIPLLLFIVLAPAVFSFAFGAQWRGAGEYARILAPMHYLAFISSPLTPTLNLLEQQVWQLAWDVGRLLLTLGSLWLVYLFGGSARMAIAAFGCAMLIGYATHLPMSYWAISVKMRHHKVPEAYVAESTPYVEV